MALDLDREHDIEELRRIAQAQQAQIQQLLDVIAAKSRETERLRSKPGDLQLTLKMFEALQAKAKHRDRCRRSRRGGAEEASRGTRAEETCRAHQERADAAAALARDRAGVQSRRCRSCVPELRRRHAPDDLPVRGVRAGRRGRGPLRAGPGQAAEVRILERHGLVVTSQTLCDLAYAIAKRLTLVDTGTHRARAAAEHDRPRSDGMAAPRIGELQAVADVVPDRAWCRRASNPRQQEPRVPRPSPISSATTPARSSATRSRPRRRCPREPGRHARRLLGARVSQVRRGQARVRRDPRRIQKLALGARHPDLDLDRQGCGVRDRELRPAHSLRRRGRIPLDNNATERAIRGPVVGRKNHYGSKSRSGTQVAATLYTILETAKLHGIDPAAYLAAAIAAGDRGTALLPWDFAAAISKDAPTP